MARKPSPTLTATEIRLMNVLWDKERATVAEVTSAMPRRNAVAYTTVQTMLKILEEKGYVTHEQAGRAFVYRPIVAKKTARQRAIGYLTKTLFEGSPSLLVLNVLEDEKVDRSEIERLKELINKS
jgi:predicted transcriptional regulator